MGEGGGSDLGWRRCEGVDSPRCSLPRSLLISNQLPHHPSQFNMDTVPTICIAFSSLLMLCYVHGLVEYPLVPGCVKLCDGQGVHYQSVRILQYHQRMVIR